MKTRGASTKHQWLKMAASLENDDGTNIVDNIAHVLKMICYEFALDAPNPEGETED